MLRVGICDDESNFEIYQNDILSKGEDNMRSIIIVFIRLVNIIKNIYLICTKKDIKK